MTTSLSSASFPSPAPALSCRLSPLSGSPSPEAAGTESRSCGLPLERFAVLASAAVAGVCLAAVIAVSLCWHALYLDARESALDSRLDRGFEPAVLEVPAPSGLPQKTGSRALAGEACLPSLG